MKAASFPSRSKPPSNTGIRLGPLERRIEDGRLLYRNITVELDRARAVAHLIIRAPQAAPISNALASAELDDSCWPLAFAREIDDAILHLRFNEDEIGSWVFHTQGDGRLVESYDRWLLKNQDNCLIHEIVLYLKRVFKRLELSSRSLFAFIEPGSCFTGTLLELALAADRAYMLNSDERPEGAPTIGLTEMNFGWLPKCNGLSRLETRSLGDPAYLEILKQRLGDDLDADLAADLGLVGFTPDEIDWDDEVRLALEERAAFSPDALTGLEASLRFAGPETLETKIFARLSAWQNWIFQRPNAVGDNGALKLYGTGKLPEFDRRRV